MSDIPFRALVLAGVLAVIALGPAMAQDASPASPASASIGQVQQIAQGIAENDRPDGRTLSRNQPGKFDFYVLSLSWSPSFCREAEERGRSSGGDQCRGRPYSFVVHGLWPQYERGFPRDCQVPAPRLNRDTMKSMLDLMPAPGLIYHEWDQHGTCSGLPAQAYFDLVRKAREAITIPDSYAAPKATLTVTPDAVEDAFINSNPGLSHSAIAVTCSSTRLSEVRICLGKDLKFRDCGEVDRRACRRDKLIMPPVRGGLM